jgi:hypothetical protein
MTSPRILPSVLPDSERRIEVFIVVHHTITDPETAFARGHEPPRRERSSKAQGSVYSARG